MINSEQLDVPPPPKGELPPCTDCVHDYAVHLPRWDSPGDYAPGCAIPGCPCTVNQTDLMEPQ